MHDSCLPCPFDFCVERLDPGNNPHVVLTQQWTDRWHTGRVDRVWQHHEPAAVRRLAADLAAAAEWLELAQHQARGQDP